MSSPIWEAMRQLRWSAFRAGKYNVGEVAGQTVIFPLKIDLVGAERLLFPPLDHALIHAMACEVIAETEEPLSRNRCPTWCGERKRLWTEK